MQPSSINEPDTSWKRHFEPLLFCIHCANAVWIIRIFTMNNIALTRNYFIDFIFLTAYLISLILTGIKWRIIFKNFELVKNSYSYLNLINDIIYEMYSFLPYFIKFKPSQKEINDFLISKKNYVIKDTIQIVKIISLLPKQLLVNIIIIMGVILLPFYHTTPKLLSIWMNSNWILNSIFHFILFNIFMYSTLIMIFSSFSFFKLRK
jgi:hypothetical protein